MPTIASTIVRARDSPRRPGRPRGGARLRDARNRVRGAKGPREGRELGDRNGSFVGVRRHRREEGIVNLPGGLSRRRHGPPRRGPMGCASISRTRASPAARDLRSGGTLPFARTVLPPRRLHPRENARPNRGAAHFPCACNPLSGDPRGSALMQPWDLRRYPAMLARVSQGKGDRVWPRSHAERPPLHALAGTRGRNRASRGRAPGR